MAHGCADSPAVDEHLEGPIVDACAGEESLERTERLLHEELAPIDLTGGHDLGGGRGQAGKVAGKDLGERGEETGGKLLSSQRVCLECSEVAGEERVDQQYGRGRGGC